MFQPIPDIQGRHWTGDVNSQASLNKEFWITPTSYDGSRYYAWNEVAYGTDGNFYVLDGGRYGTQTVCPVITPNGATLTINGYYLVRRGYFDSSKDWIYVVSGGDGTGGGLTSPLTTKGDIWGYSTTNARIPVGANGLFLKAASGQSLGVTWAASTLEIKDVSGAHDYPGTTILEFDQSQGFVVSNPSGTTVEVSISSASASVPGIVTTGAQSFAGVKSFGSSIYIAGGITLSTTNSLSWDIGGVSGGTQSGGISCQSSGGGGSPFSGTIGNNIQFGAYISSGSGVGYLALYPDGIDFQTLALRSNGNIAVASHSVTLAKLTTGGTNGSMTITNGLVTAITDPT